MSLKNARFAYNNYLDSQTLTTTGAQAGYPTSNLLSPIRSKLWKASNVFEIHAKNCKVYIDATTYTIPTGTYTKAQLITAFNTALGAAGTLSVGDGDRFEITFPVSKTLNLSNQTDAIWDVIGFLGTADRAGLVLQGDERRYNTGVWFKVDLGLPQMVDFAALLAPAGEVFACNTATIKMQGNNINQWDTPPVNLDFEVSGEGAFFSATPSQPCRFWRIFIDDVKNDNIQAAVAFMGSAVIPVDTNVAIGFTRTREDTSIKLVSENGTFYVDRRPKILSISGMSIQLIKDDDLLEMEQLFYDLGVEKPFFLCLDPRIQVSKKLSQMTHYLAVTSPLQLQHVLRGYYNVSVELREVV